MKVKIYLSEWFYNAGIIGFLRILEKNKDNFVEVEKNYIEFDTDNLRNFDRYYFYYFFDRYNVAKKVVERTKDAFDYLCENVENYEDKLVKDEIKISRKNIKNIVIKQIDKIKKIDDLVFDKMKDACDRLDKEDTKDGVEQIRNILLENIQKEDINKRLTLNLFKSILGNTYYGQPSFLNVSKTGLAYEEQQKVMYVDYVSNIVETGFIYDIIHGKYNMDELEHVLEEKLKSERITKEFKKVYEKIRKFYIRKDRTIEEIEQYLRENVMKHCCMCENDFGITSNYSESNFSPLMVSSNNARNFFWNQNVQIPICDVCKLILFCIPAGVTDIRKIVKDRGKYIENSVLNFVNYDTGVDDLLEINNKFQQNSINQNKNESLYAKMILDIVGMNRKISKLQLANMFIVEFDSKYGDYSRIENLNIKSYVSEFLIKYAKTSLFEITDYKYKLQLVDYMLKNKDIKNLINEMAKEEINNKSNGQNLFYVVVTRAILNLLRKEENGMAKTEKINKSDNNLRALYDLGVDINRRLKKSNQENKINGYAYKMLNNIRAGNMNGFMDVLFRMNNALKIGVPVIFIDAMNDSDLDFASMGYSFLSGLIS